VSARLLLLASGTGTTVEAIAQAVETGRLNAKIVAVGADIADCGAIDKARWAGIETFSVVLSDYPTRADWNEALADVIAQYRPDIVCCAGFMRVLGPAVVGRFDIVNTHPSLLPAFPGAHAVRDALEHGVKVTGVTIHRVDEGLDTGPILAQVAVSVVDDDTEDSLRERIQAAEKPLYVDAIIRLCKEIP
jgi:phosphoribosylglycinamide formyltransferase-1